MTGGDEKDDFTGDEGNDTLTGGGGSDVLDGGPDDDRVFARDGAADTVRCGSETDTATADQRSVDKVDGDCESTAFLPEPAPDPAPFPLPPPAPTPDPAPAPGPGGDPPADTGGNPSAPDTGSGAAADVPAALTLELTGARSQRIARQEAVTVTVRCPAAASAATAGARGDLGRPGRRRGGPAARTTLTTKAVTRQLPVGAAATLRLRLTGRQVRDLRAALAAGRRPKLRLTVRASDAAGHRVARSRTVRARA